MTARLSFELRLNGMKKSCRIIQLPSGIRPSDYMNKKLCEETHVFMVKAKIIQCFMN